MAILTVNTINWADRKKRKWDFVDNNDVSATISSINYLCEKKANCSVEALVSTRNGSVRYNFKDHKTAFKDKLIKQKK